MVILFFILVLTILILQCRLTLGFTFIMENLVCSAFVTIYIFGNMALKKIIVFPKQIKKKEKAEKIRKKRDLVQLEMSFIVLLKLFKKSLLLKDFKLYVKEGTGDAYYTAILSGFIWSLTGLIPKLVFTKYKVKNKKIEIETDFNEKVWKLNFDCIFSLKIVNIISMCKEITIYYLKNRKGGDADVKSSNRRSNDYSHAKY